ncbi:CRISPR-associated protein Cas5, Apern subtype [Pyrococcus sp. NA2]|uniref:type I-A CRISPR-associated protein Cas5a n=1 Tax=Pyrococcus sp. (strain NA2) TaxID=342949 RepID=UPI000209AC10|nr:type I-A CRISPR-associated protein Cas5a [Pyrococcus sp. NA2]AEC52734.1 CRISPR-associated protein Cas5, Apern subtype [Pyrococcus sp. NA2]
MDILLVLLRFPFFSVARRSYQVRTSLLLPSPSALKGALAKGLIMLEPEKYLGISLDTAAKKAVAEIENKLVNIRAIYVSPRTPLVKTAFLLKRLRNLEPIKDEKKIKTEEDWEKAMTKSDAMRREYTFTRELLVAYIFRDLSEEERERYLKAAMLIDTIGDTESLATPVWASFIKPKKRTATLAFSAPYEEISNLLSRGLKNKGKIKIYYEDVRISPDYSGISGGRGVPEERFYLPIEERRYRRTLYYIRTNSAPEVEDAIEFDGEVLGIWISKSSLKG